MNADIPVSPEVALARIAEVGGGIVALLADADSRLDEADRRISFIVAEHRRRQAGSGDPGWSSYSDEDLRRLAADLGWRATAGFVEKLSRLRAETQAAVDSASGCLASVRAELTSRDLGRRGGDPTLAIYTEDALGELAGAIERDTEAAPAVFRRLDELRRLFSALSSEMSGVAQGSLGGGRIDTSPEGFM